MSNVSYFCFKATSFSLLFIILSTIYFVVFLIIVGIYNSYYIECVALGCILATVTLQIHPRVVKCFRIVGDTVALPC